MAEFTAPSGAKVKINTAPFEDAEDLKDIILKEIANSGVDFDFNLSKGMEQDVNFGTFANAFLRVASSKEVRKALNKCLVRCTYNGEKITPATFEDTEARKDYYEIQMACMKENILPFFEGLFSRLSPYITAFKNQTEKNLSQK